ncbi:endoglucanase [Phycisphaerales bacterium]|nr:endoglucanase [Phycisphaerales bacterium]
MPRFLFALLGFLAAAVAALAQPPATQPAGVPPERLAALAKGVNLSHWLWLPARRDLPSRTAYFTREDALALQALGLTHVRLPIEQSMVFDDATRQLRLDGMKELRSALSLCLEVGLAVIIDPHQNEPPWTTRDASGSFPLLESFWAAFAPAIADADPRRVFLEILNEPHDDSDPGVWSASQARLVRIIRKAAPSHTIIATGDKWGSIDGLLALKALDDENVVYSFHVYEPHIFTHQGASWGWPGWKEVRGLVYPASADNAESVVKSMTSKDGIWSVRDYAKTAWDSGRVREHVQKAVAWGKENRASLYCGEFGVYAAHAPRESRLAWIRDVRTALEEAGVGWAMWDYSGGFALRPGGAGKRATDVDVVDSLGLKGRPPLGPE